MAILSFEVIKLVKDMFWKEHIPVSEIDETLGLHAGQAHDVIVDAWYEDSERKGMKRRKGSDADVDGMHDR